MTHSARSSSGSASCRLEWRPSNWVYLVLLALGALAAFCVLASEMPRALAWPMAAAALAHGAGIARGYRRQPARIFVLRGHPLVIEVDGVAVRAWRLRWRGPLAFLGWRDAAGRAHHCSWWPDTLPPGRRRELRLAATAGPAAPAAPSVAP
jgi:toxin CptA